MTDGFDVTASEIDDSAGSRVVLVVALAGDLVDHSFAIDRGLRQRFEDDPALDDLFEVGVSAIPEGVTQREIGRWAGERLHALASGLRVRHSASVGFGVVVVGLSERVRNEVTIALETSPERRVPYHVYRVPVARRVVDLINSVVDLCREIARGIDGGEIPLVASATLSSASPDVELTMLLPGVPDVLSPPILQQPHPRRWVDPPSGGRDARVGTPDESTVPAPESVNLGTTWPGADRVSPSDVALRGQTRLLYLMWLGEAGDWTSRKSQRAWVQDFINSLADRTNEFSMRMLGCGDGISNQTTLTLASDFRRTGWQRRLRIGHWPPAVGGLDMIRVCSDLIALMHRDIEALEYDGIGIIDVTCVVLVGEPPTSDGPTIEAYTKAANDLNFVWVTPTREAEFISLAYRNPTGTTSLIEHPEIADELLRKLGVRGAPTTLSKLLPRADRGGHHQPR